MYNNRHRNLRENERNSPMEWQAMSGDAGSLVPRCTWERPCRENFNFALTQAGAIASEEYDEMYLSVFPYVYL